MPSCLHWEGGSEGEFKVNLSVFCVYLSIIYFIMTKEYEEHVRARQQVQGKKRIV